VAFEGPLQVEQKVREARVGASLDTTLAILTMLPILYFVQAVPALMATPPAAVLLLPMGLAYEVRRGAEQAEDRASRQPTPTHQAGAREYVREPAGRANIGRAKRILKRAGRRKPPVPGDEL
jgi:hypothetical protein